VGDVINYTITIENTGNVTVNNINVTDPNATTMTCVGSPYTLAPGETASCDATHVITLTDLNAGSVSNIATASGIDPSGDPVTDPSNEVTVDAIQTPELTVIKSKATAINYSAVGQIVTYTIIVQNTGNVSVSNIDVIDPVADVGSISCSGTDLNPGGSFTCTASHTVDQADLDAGQIVNIATAQGEDPNGDQIIDYSNEVVVPADLFPAISIIKTADDRTDVVAGQVITYTYAVTNLGNVTLYNVTVSDVHNGQGTLSSINPPVVPILPPGGTTTYTSSYEVTQADIDAGVDITNLATATGDLPAALGGTVTATDNESLDPVDQLPALEVTKGAVETIYDLAGDILHYNITVENTGNVTITNIAVTDPNADTGSINCSGTELAPGESFTCTAEHAVTQADVDAGEVVNIASGNGLDPNGDPVGDSSNEVIVLADQQPEITIIKGTTAIDFSFVGEIINYNFVVQNNGNVTITDIVVSDPHVDPGSISCNGNTLAPTESFTCTATYTIDQTDLNNGSISNIASVTGLDPNSDPVDDVSNEIVIYTQQQPAMTINKVADDNTDVIAGQLITYTYTVVNTGDQTIYDVAVSDVHNGTGALSNILPVSVDSLVPTQQTVFTSTYVVDQADIDAGVDITNTATATGIPAGGTLVDPTDDESVDVVDQLPEYIG